MALGVLGQTYIFVDILLSFVIIMDITIVVVIFTEYLCYVLQLVGTGANFCQRQT